MLWTSLYDLDLLCSYWLWATLLLLTMSNFYFCGTLSFLLIVTMSKSSQADNKIFFMFLTTCLFTHSDYELLYSYWLWAFFPTVDDIYFLLIVTMSKNEKSSKTIFYDLELFCFFTHSDYEQLCSYWPCAFFTVVHHLPFYSGWLEQV